MQIVYISNRPQIFAETLMHVILCMEFIDNIVICVPDNLIETFHATKSKLPIVVIPESALLDQQEQQRIRELDHQSRNYLLRTRLAQSNNVEPQFIMSDDDARPLKKIDLEQFINNGRYRRYFFYDLALWNNNQTEFDAGQIATWAILQHHDLPHLAYASHMPQIIDKALLLEAAEFFSGYATKHPLCEWSTYFNFASSRHPERFCEPEAYQTLCWPEHPLAWKEFVTPERYLFENVTPSLYEPKGIFTEASCDILDSAKLEQTNINKIIAWAKYRVAIKHPERTEGAKKYFKVRTWINKLHRSL